MPASRLAGGTNPIFLYGREQDGSFGRVGGFVQTIEGGVDAELLSDYMASFKDPEAYAMSHIGWGLQPRAQ